MRDNTFYKRLSYVKKGLFEAYSGTLKHSVLSAFISDIGELHESYQGR